MTDGTSTPDREFDLVLIGATGFVGRLIAAHLAKNAPGHLRIALAGRNRERLESARSALPENAASWPLVQVDTLDEASVTELADRTRVVASTVGPYAKYGAELVAACANAGTHYCDLTGEVLFVRDMIDQHHATAQGTGARIVVSCGFDSVPSDLGVFVTAQRAATDGAGTLTDTTLYVREMRGGFSGGTIDSMRHQLAEMSKDRTRLRQVRDPYGLSPDRSKEPSGNRDAARPSSLLGRAQAKLPARHDPLIDRWVAPFVMASYNTRVVRRSNALTDWSYGRGLRYRELQVTGRGVRGALGAVALTAVFGAAGVGMTFAPTRALLARLLPAPGEGPSTAKMEKGHFHMEIEATTSTGARYRTRVAADKDPGYTGTAVMLGESALALADDGDRLPSRAGVLTPATALGEPLVERLREHGFTLETHTA